MANVEDKFRSLVEALYLRSTSGDIKWTGYSGSSSYFTSVGQSKIEVNSSINSGGEALITVNVFDAEGNQVDTFNDEYFPRKLEPQHVAASNYFLLMSNLFEVARRNATGADKVLDEVLLNLNAPKIDSDDDVLF